MSSISFALSTNLQIAGTLTISSLASSMLRVDSNGVVSTTTLQSNLSLSVGGTLSLATALVSINSITAASTTDLTLAGGSSGASLVLGQGATKTIKINGGENNRNASITGTCSLQIRGVSGGDVLQLYTSSGSGYQPFLRVSDGNGTMYFGANAVFSGRTAASGSGGFAVPYTGDVPSMLAVQSDLGNTSGTSAVVIQSGGPLSDMIQGYGNDTSALNFNVTDGGLVTAAGGLIGGLTGLVITASTVAAQSITLTPSTTGNVNLALAGGKLDVRSTSANHPRVRLSSTNAANVDFEIANIAESNYTQVTTGLGTAFKLYHSTSQVELPTAIASTTISTGALVLTGSSAGLGVAGAGNFGGTVTAPTFVGAVTGHASLDLPLTGGTLTGALLFTDNTYDIGASGATRPRTGYFGTSIVVPTLTGTNFVTSASSTDLTLTGNGSGNIILASTSGNVTTARPLLVTNATASTSTSTGALVVSGGVGLTGALYVGSAIEATSITVAGTVLSGGLAVTKSLVIGGGHGWGVTSTATSGGTLTLTAASTTVQILTGAVSHSVQLPAANALGVSIAITYALINRSSSGVTLLAAGTNLIEGVSTYALPANTSLFLFSDGAGAWRAA